MKKYTLSKNRELRQVAQLACLNYDPELLSFFLKDYPYCLSTWDQMHLFDLLIWRVNAPPDLHGYLQHNNPTVVIFALRMIRFFYLKNERESEIIPLLTHSNEQIRYEALKTAVDLNIDQVNKLLLAYISEINEKYKELIIEFLIKNKIVSSGELMDFFHQENDKRHKLYILQTIYNKDPRGDELIKKLKDFTNNEEIDSMCLHVLNNAY